MNRIRRSSNSWFKVWDMYLSLEDALSRVSLSEKSGASVQTIKALQLDWMRQNDIVYSNGVFSHFKPKKNISISLYIPPPDSEKEDMK